MPYIFLLFFFLWTYVNFFSFPSFLFFCPLFAFLRWLLVAGCWSLSAGSLASVQYGYQASMSVFACCFIIITSSRLFVFFCNFHYHIPFYLDSSLFCFLHFFLPLFSGPHPYSPPPFSPLSSSPSIFGYHGTKWHLS